jgi:hypothetical protein
MKELRLNSLTLTNTILKMNYIRMKHFTLSSLLAFALLFSAFGQNNSIQKNLSTHGMDHNNSMMVKLTPVVFGGNRYVVEADFGLENKVPLMVHGNARLYLMITHDIAEQLNDGNPIEKIRDYGYSDKGMGRINVEKFQVGDRTFTNTENVSVFDWPKEEGKAAQGMLGIYFLKKENVRIDFVNEQLEIGVELNEMPDKKLLDQGYSYTRISVENGEGYMNVYFDAFNKEIPITVGTVSDEYSLDLVTFQNGIELEITDSKGHSPSGTTPEIYTNTAPIKYRIANQSFEIPSKKTELYSFAEYENVKQSELFPFGIFGRDWMKENNAIIDYANNILYFKRNETVDK